MRVVIQLSGQMSIDLNRLDGERANDNGAGLDAGRTRARESSTAPESTRARGQESGAGRPDLDLTDITSLEQALVLALAMLLGHHHDQAAEPPSYAVIAACTDVLEEIAHHGELAGSSARDASFLSQLVAILEALADRVPKPFMENLITSIRRMLDDLGDNDDGEGQDDGGNGNGRPGNDENGPGGNTPGGSNGTPGNGIPGNGTPTDGAPGDGTPENGTPGNGTPGNGTPDRGGVE